MKNLHIVLHTHWDREWYFTTTDSLILLNRTLKNIVKTLESNKNVTFCLDGQSSILFEFLEINPSYESRIKNLILNDQLIVGPWYTQTDVQLVDQESIVKNLQYGIYDLKSKYNKYMNIGYLPDTFGFNAQMPTILNHANIDSFIFWRGIDLNKAGIKPYFNWEGQSSRTVKSFNFVGGYGMAKGLNTSESYIEEILVKKSSEYEKYGILDNVLIPVGNDQNEIIENINEKIATINQDERLNLKLTKYQDFIDSFQIEENQKYIGEMRDTVGGRVHKTIGSVRYNIKYSNYLAEQQLLQITEPLYYFANLFNVDTNDEILKKAWKLLFEGQAHDGICGCVSDSVMLDICNRNKQALEIGMGLENIILKEISETLNLTDKQIVVFNQEVNKNKFISDVEVFSKTSSIKFLNCEDYVITEVVKYQGHDNALIETPVGNFYEKEEDYYLIKAKVKQKIPPLSYYIFEFEEKEELIKSSDNQYIKNNKYELSYEEGNLTLKVEDQEIKDFIKFIDVGNTGDTYDFSPLLNEEEIEFFPKLLKTYSENGYGKMIFSDEIYLPKNLEERKKNIKSIGCRVDLIATIYDDEVIKFSVKFDNNVLSHRIQVSINTGINPTESKASISYGTQIRKVTNEKVEENWRENNIEKPIDVETFDGFVLPNVSGKVICAYSQAGKEYQIKDGRINLTVLATTNQLGKENLEYRPGRASGDTTKKGNVLIPTPLAELEGEIKFDFAVGYNENNDLICYKELSNYRHKTIKYQRQKINLKHLRIDDKIMPFTSESVVKIFTHNIKIDENLIVTNIAPALYNDGFIIRGFNPTNDKVLINQELSCINLLEEELTTNEVLCYDIFAVLIRKGEK